MLGYYSDFNNFLIAIFDFNCKRFNSLNNTAKNSHQLFAMKPMLSLQSISAVHNKIDYFWAKTKMQNNGMKERKLKQKQRSTERKRDSIKKNAVFLLDALEATIWNHTKFIRNMFSFSIVNTVNKFRLCWSKLMA